MIGIPSMDNYIIQYEGKSWEEEGWMTKRYLVAGNSFSRSVILRESEKDFPRPAEFAEQNEPVAPDRFLSQPRENLPSA